MTRRGDPELIYRAQRAGVFMRLASEARLNSFEAEEWIDRWEREAADLGWPRSSSQYWDEAWRWIEAQRRSPTVDTTSMNAEGDDGQVHGG